MRPNADPIQLPGNLAVLGLAAFTADADNRVEITAT
jgi:hypothetical protein